MNIEQGAAQSDQPNDAHRRTRWTGLQFRLTISYMLTALCSVLLVEVLLGAVVIVLLLYTPVLDDEFSAGTRLTARQYALMAAVQVGDRALDVNMTFEPDAPASIALPDDDRTNNATRVSYLKSVPSGHSLVTFALLVAPNGSVMASSYPAQYPAGKRITQMVPNLAGAVMDGLTGISASRVDMIEGERVISTIEPIRNRSKQIVGLIFMQVPELPTGVLVQGFGTLWLISSTFWLFIMLPISGLFGWITTRGLLYRLHRLVSATVQFADEDYTPRVPVARHDEIGQLEAHFNRMAIRLAESITLQQALTAQNARMSERNRIARDLHDSVKQQMFTVAMQLGAALSVLDSQPPAVRQFLTDAEDITHHVQQELTNLIHELRPLNLQGQCLAGALREYALKWGGQQHIQMNMQLAEAISLPEMAEETLWRVMQEALTNVARHSQASAVTISLEDRDGIVSLSITDNGCGFDKTQVSAQSIGLQSMAERMAALDGTLLAQSTIGVGTTISAACPHQHRLPLASSADVSNKAVP